MLLASLPIAAITSLEEHQLLVFWADLCALVIVARVLGAMMRRIGLPSVIGELGAGLVLGPSVLGKVWPEAFDWLFPPDDVQSGMLLAVGWVGIALLLLLTGFETDLDLIRRLGKAALLVTGFSIIVPFLGGLGVGAALPDSFVGEEVSRGVFTLFVAAALSVSSLAVVGKILSELGLMRRDFGQITVAAGMANDLVGWLMLAIFAGLATSGVVSVSVVATIVGGLALFLFLAGTVGQRIVDGLLRQMRRDGENAGGTLTVTIFVMLGFAVVTQALGVEGVLGAFVAGVIVQRSRYRSEATVELVEGLTVRFLGPVFFATAGLRVDLALLGQPSELAAIGLILAVALSFKFVGAYVGARQAGLTRREGVALGAGLNARGALEIVIATVALGLGVFSDEAFTAIVMVPIVTSVFASITLRLVVRGWRGTVEEQERLQLEESMARNIVVKSGRILLASRGQPGSIAAAQVLHFAWPRETPATVLVVGSDAVDLSPIVNVLDDRPHEVHSRKGQDVAEEIVAEARLGYGIIGLGAEGTARECLVSPVIDALLPIAPVPVVIVRPARNLATRLPGVFTKALVPVVGSRSSRAAQEIAFNMSKQLGTEVTLAHVVTQAQKPQVPFLPSQFQPGRYRRAEADEIASRVLDQAVELASEIGVDAHATVRSGDIPGSEIVKTAEDLDVDLVVVGARLRRFEGRAFLGYSVETVLEEADATVVVVIVPDPADEA